MEEWRWSLSTHPRNFVKASESRHRDRFDPAG
jgi:hypothetical protein